LCVIVIIHSDLGINTHKHFVASVVISPCKQGNQHLCNLRSTYFAQPTHTGTHIFTLQADSELAVVCRCLYIGVQCIT